MPFFRANIVNIPALLEQMGDERLIGETWPAVPPPVKTMQSRKRPP